MNQKIKGVLTGCLLMALLVLMAGCAAEMTPYEKNDAENYCISVKFDANGGLFTTNTSVIVDSYNLTDLPLGENGQAEAALIAPDHSARGNDAFTAVKNDCFLAGWYTQRIENADGTCTYAGKWDFDTDTLKVDPNGSYTASEPVLTLYAAWVPLFRVDFVDRSTGEALGSYTYDPTADAQLQVPQWSPETGAIEMYKFPSRQGFTFEKAYYDEAGTQPVETEQLVHSGSVDLETGTAVGSTMTVYTDWTEGEWYHIYNVEQFMDNASVSGSYVLHADLDFAGQIWPTSLMHGNFSGTVQGNGYTLRNIELIQTNNTKVNTGLFGNLTETAVISDVTFENVILTVKGGTRVAGASFGLLAGSISDKAQLANVTVLDSRLLIDPTAYFGTGDYVIGLVCGMGNTDIDDSGITAAVSGEDSGLYAVTVDGMVTLTDTPPAVEESVPDETTAEEPTA